RSSASRSRSCLGRASGACVGPPSSAWLLLRVHDVYTRSSQRSRSAVPAPRGFAPPQCRTPGVPSARGEHDPLEAQRLAHRPRLERAAARGVRRIAVGDLRQVAEARVVQMSEQRIEKAIARLGLRARGGAPDAEPRLDERAHEPGPDRPLMVRAVALADPTLVAGPVPRLVGCEGAEADGCQQPRLDGVDDAAGAFSLEHGERQAADGEYLVRAEARVHGAAPVVDVDHIVEATAGLVPEPGL